MAFCTQSTFLNKARGFEWDMFTLHETKMASDGTCTWYGGESIDHSIGCLMKKFATQDVIHNIVKSLWGCSNAPGIVVCMHWNPPWIIYDFFKSKIGNWSPSRVLVRVVMNLRGSPSTTLDQHSIKYFKALRIRHI